jgi:hypothetical protein
MEEVGVKENKTNEKAERVRREDTRKINDRTWTRVRTTETTSHQKLITGSLLDVIKLGPTNISKILQN